MPSEFLKTDSIITLAGPAGSGKTRLLHALAALGAQTIDLEGLAHHKGSVFGNLSQVSQPSRQAFQQVLAQEWENLDLGKPVFLESEGPYIGALDIPKPLYEQMVAAPMILLQTDRSQRIANILTDYGAASRDLIQTAIEKLAPKLGIESAGKCLSFLHLGNFTALIDLLLTYYDQSEHYQVDLRRVLFTIPISQLDFKTAGSKVLKKIGLLLR